MALGVAGLAAGPALAAGDAANGAAIFKVTCALCHMARKDAAKADLAMRIGPNLYGVVGRKAGTYKPFNYSYAMRSSGITWTDDQLLRYIANPQKAVPNVRMSFLGLKNPKQAEDVLAYLHTMK
ncbi:MAG: c-type cytochrome [Caulobacteraceae bacterium]